MGGDGRVVRNTERIGLGGGRFLEGVEGVVVGGSHFLGNAERAGPTAGRCVLRHVLRHVERVGLDGCGLRGVVGLSPGGRVCRAVERPVERAVEGVVLVPGAERAALEAA